MILTDDDGQSEHGTPRALLTIAGQPLVEYQARVARAAGADHIVVLVDRLPTALVEAFDRLRDDGINVDVARSARDAADRIHPDERVFVMSSGAVAAAGTLRGKAREKGAIVLSLPASEENAHLERIDGEHRWTGLALIPGSTLRTTADMLGDWALGPTLLRTALQHGARTDISADVYMVRDAIEARQASLALIGGDRRSGGLGERKIVAPLAAVAMPLLIARRFPFDLVAVLPFVLLGLSALTALLVWPGTAAAALFLSAISAETANRLAAAGGRSTALLEWFPKLRPAAFLLVAASAGWQMLASGQGWGPLALAAWASIALYLQPSSGSLRGWMADAESGSLVLLAAIVAGVPLAGLVTVLTHAVVTQFVLIRST